MCIRDRNSGEMMTKNNEEIINEVSGNYSKEFNSEIKSDNSDAVENRVFTYDTASSNSDDESRKLFGVSDGVVISIDEFGSIKARKYFSDFVLPFAWKEIVQGGSERVMGVGVVME